MAQERLAAILRATYVPKSHVHGYVCDRSFLTNAQYHVGQKWILNVDIEDFFGSITFPRVRGLFQTYFGYSDRVATTLARICTYQGKLPQGAKTSPVLANLIAHNLDKSLLAIATKHSLRFSRYADDITFSTSQRRFPPSLVTAWEPLYGDREIQLGGPLKDAFMKAGFRINQTKTRIQRYDERQVVTGLVVNKKANVWRSDIKRLRMKLHSAHKFSADEAAKIWIGPSATQEDFVAHVEGWLAFIRQVRGKNDAVLSKLCQQAVVAGVTQQAWVKELAKTVHEFDVFLSHASEDKPKVRLLRDALEHLGVNVFFDEDSITWGDSIVEKINEGLLRSSFFVPFLSETFAAKGWTNKELNSAITNNVQRKGRILPITDAGFEVEDNYPLLNDILYKSWPAEGPEQSAQIEELADQLLAVIEKNKLKAQ